MRSDMSAYGVTELTPEEELATAGGEGIAPTGCGCGWEVRPIEGGYHIIQIPCPEQPNP